MVNSHSEIVVNNRSYKWPDRPLVVICLDGSEPDYMALAMEQGFMPYLKKTLPQGTSTIANCVIPGFTNPNNMSIVTGTPPKVHGICGNYFYDKENDAEVMMNDPKFLCADTIFAEFAKAGAKIAVVTAKDKLRLMLGSGLQVEAGKIICISAEKADLATQQDNGIDRLLDFVGSPLPDVYSGELSEFVFAAGIKIVDKYRPDLTYLSTSDYVQHKFAPGTPAANQFYAMIDRYLAQLDAAGVTIALTADHGMNAKTDAQGNPDIIFLQTLLDNWFGENKTRVILPITDPYVVHHGALGSFATIYVEDAAILDDVLSRISTLEGVMVTLPREQGCQRFGLMESRMGDILVVSTKHKVLGTSPDRHNLSALKEPLRSHGGISEQRVPFMLNRSTTGLKEEGQLRNFDIFDAALNHVS